MAEKYVSIRNLKFLLHEVFQASNLNQFERFQDYDKEAFDFALEAAKQIGDTYLFPFYQEMDKNKVRCENGTVITHPALAKAIKALGDGGWISAIADYDEGGQQMPWTLLQSCLFVFYAANVNAAAYAFLTQAAAGLIRSFGEESLKNRFVPSLLTGTWQGTMALTEPQAGSSLSDVVSTATPTKEDYFKIKGQKIFISGGDHEDVENVVHLLLARIKGAPAGTKGISLFVVPKKRLENGSLVGNDVTTAGVFGKMGQRGYVAAHLMLGENDDCRGWLLGKAHNGLPYMFQMMNEARIGTGNMAAAMASAAYYASLQYANERLQGRHPSKKDAMQPQVLIIEHADVRRMLLFQKAVAEGSISLLLQCSYYGDLSHEATNEEDRKKAHLLLELLTPIAKSYPSEMGNLAVSAGMQVLGGAGYTNDFPLEQYYRDIRVNAIYEGTTGIQGLDLLGRKVMLEKGKALKLFLIEVKKTIATAADSDQTNVFGEKLGEAAKSLHEVTLHLVGEAMQNPPEVFLADATLYLEFFGHIAVGWQWLKQGIVAAKALEAGATGDEFNFYSGKIFTMKYFFEYELPKTKSLQERLLSEEKVTLDIKKEFLN